MLSTRLIITFMSKRRTRAAVLMKVMLIAHCVCAIVAVSPQAADAGDDVVQFDRAGKSAYVGGRSPTYAREALAFTDIDGDGLEEVVGIELSDTYPRGRTATVSVWNGEERLIEWRSPRLQGLNRVLVGNVDVDPLDEVVLFGDGVGVQPGEDTLRVLDWSEGSYRGIGTNRLSGRVGALLDVDGDGVQEVVLASIRRKLRDGEGRDPVTLSVWRLSGGFELIAKLDLGAGVCGIAAGDLDGDGIDEVVTCEESHDGKIGGQIAVYEVDASEVRPVVQRNGLVSSLAYLGVFQSGGYGYVFVEQGKEAWKAVFRLTTSVVGAADLVAQRGHDPALFEDAIKSTMAYSAERRAFVRVVGPDQYGFVSDTDER